MKISGGPFNIEIDYSEYEGEAVYLSVYANISFNKKGNIAGELAVTTAYYTYVATDTYQLHGKDYVYEDIYFNIFNSKTDTRQLASIDVVDNVKGKSEHINLAWVTLENTHKFKGSNLTDLIYGSFDNNILRGGGGSDIIQSRWGSDWIYGGKQSDELYGGGGEDHLFGGAGNDIIWSTDEEAVSTDTPDFMTGGGGRDVFVMNWASGTDFIEDFEAGPNGDKIKVYVSNGIKNFHDLIENHVEIIEGDVHIFGRGKSTFVLDGVVVDDLEPSNFLFYPD